MIDNRIVWQNLLVAASSMTEEEKARVSIECWSTVKGDDLPGGVDILVATMAFDHGAATAATLLQRCVGFTDPKDLDTFIGPATIRKALAANPLELIDSYHEACVAYERGQPGWTPEVSERLETLHVLARHSAPAVAPTITAKSGAFKTKIVSLGAAGLVAVSEMLPMAVDAMPAAKGAYSSVADLLEPYGDMPKLVIGAVVIIGILYTQIRSARLSKAAVDTGASGVSVA